MQKATLVRISAVLFVLLLFLGTSVWAQKLADRPKQAAMRSLAYDATQETVMEGTVLSYSAEPATPPIGAHLLLHTASGPVPPPLPRPPLPPPYHSSSPKCDA